MIKKKKKKVGSLFTANYNLLIYYYNLFILYEVAFIPTGLCSKNELTL